MRTGPRFLAPLVAIALLAAACSDATDTIPLFPGGTTPPTPITTADPVSPSDPESTDPGQEPTTVGGSETTEASPSTTAAPVDPNQPALQEASHPLDGLTPGELKTFKEVLAADGRVDGSQFPYVTLDQPDKQFVLSWQAGQPFPRRAFAIIRRDDATFETVVDLIERQVVSWTEMPGAQPGFVGTEFSRAGGAARQDPRFMAGLAARGLTVDESICLMFAGGAARGPGEVGRRLGRVTCYLDGSDPYFFSRPIEGLYATVDLETGEVLSISDSGPVGVPSGPALPDPQRQRPPLTPIGFDTSAGSNLSVDGYGIEWSGWSFRWRADRRTGVEIADARFDGGDGQTRVLYEGYLSDLFVPYQDPDPAWAFRTLLDSAEFGLGTTLSTLTLGVDCPLHSTLLDIAVPNDSGDASIRPGGACVFERPTGDSAWRHEGSGTDQALGNGVQEIELVLRFISTIGNYDYIVDYVFGADGAIRFHVFAAGIVLQKGVDASTAQEARAAGIDEHGVLVGDGLLATNHDHYMSFRLDLDVGQTANQMVRGRLASEPVTGDAGRTVIWRVARQEVASELGARMTPSAATPEVVTFESTTADGPVGHRPAYELDFGDAVAVAPGDVSDDPGLRRGGWADATLWVTPYDRAERFASGLYVPDGTEPAGLPAWAAQNRSLADADLVVWFTVGFHHIVRTEDVPTMPAHEAEFGLIPTNMSAYNPFLDFVPG